MYSRASCPAAACFRARLFCFLLGDIFPKHQKEMGKDETAFYRKKRNWN